MQKPIPSKTSRSYRSVNTLEYIAHLLFCYRPALVVDGGGNASFHGGITVSTGAKIWTRGLQVYKGGATVYRGGFYVSRDGATIHG